VAKALNRRPRSLQRFDIGRSATLSVFGFTAGSVDQVWCGCRIAACRVVSNVVQVSVLNAHLQHYLPHPFAARPDAFTGQHGRRCVAP